LDNGPFSAPVGSEFDPFANVGLHPSSADIEICFDYHMHDTSGKRISPSKAPNPLIIIVSLSQTKVK
jgi:hypothetical protein